MSTMCAPTIAKCLSRLSDSAEAKIPVGFLPFSPPPPIFRPGPFQTTHDHFWWTLLDVGNDRLSHEQIHRVWDKWSTVSEHGINMSTCMAYCAAQSVRGSLANNDLRLGLAQAMELMRSQSAPVVFANNHTVPDIAMDFALCIQQLFVKTLSVGRGITAQHCTKICEMSNKCTFTRTYEAGLGKKKTLAWQCSATELMPRAESLRHVLLEHVMRPLTDSSTGHWQTEWKDSFIQSLETIPRMILQHDLKQILAAVNAYYSLQWLDTIPDSDMLWICIGSRAMSVIRADDRIIPSHGEIFIRDVKSAFGMFCAGLHDTSTQLYVCSSSLQMSDRSIAYSTAPSSSFIVGTKTRLMLLWVLSSVQHSSEHVVSTSVSPSLSVPDSFLQTFRTHGDRKTARDVVWDVVFGVSMACLDPLYATLMSAVDDTSLSSSSPSVLRTFPTSGPLPWVATYCGTDAAFGSMLLSVVKWMLDDPQLVASEDAKPVNVHGLAELQQRNTRVRKHIVATASHLFAEGRESRVNVASPPGLESEMAAMITRFLIIESQLRHDIKSHLDVELQTEWWGYLGSVARASIQPNHTSRRPSTIKVRMLHDKTGADASVKPTAEIQPTASGLSLLYAHFQALDSARVVDSKPKVGLSIFDDDDDNDRDDRLDTTFVRFRLTAGAFLGWTKKLIEIVDTIPSSSIHLIVQNVLLGLRICHTIIDCTRFRARIIESPPSVISSPKTPAAAPTVIVPTAAQYIASLLSRLSQSFVSTPCIDICIVPMKVQRSSLFVFESLRLSPPKVIDKEALSSLQAWGLAQSVRSDLIHIIDNPVNNNDPPPHKPRVPPETKRKRDPSTTHSRSRHVVTDASNKVKVFLSIDDPQVPRRGKEEDTRRVVASSRPPSKRRSMETVPRRREVTVKRRADRREVDNDTRRVVHTSRSDDRTLSKSNRPHANPSASATGLSQLVLDQLQTIISQSTTSGNGQAPIIIPIINMGQK